MERTIDYASVDGGLDMTAQYDEMLNRTYYPYDDEVIPAVGRKVYIVSVDAKQIYEEEVYALGQESFLVKGFRSYKEHFGEFRYNEYFERWFLDADEAKAHLAKYLTDDEDIDEEVDGVWWTKPL